MKIRDCFYKHFKETLRDLTYNRRQWDYTSSTYINKRSERGRKKKQHPKEEKKQVSKRGKQEKSKHPKERELKKNKRLLYREKP